MKLLIAYRADVNRNSSKGTPLHDATEKGHPETMRILLAGLATITSFPAWLFPFSFEKNHYFAIFANQ